MKFVWTVFVPLGFLDLAWCTGSVSVYALNEEACNVHRPNVQRYNYNAIDLDAFILARPAR
eukprot:80776-Amphidinium_carterae.1